MKITAFNPLVVSRDPEAVIELFEALGFRKIHTKEIDGKDFQAVRMESEGGFHVDVSSGDYPKDHTLIRINVDDLKEARELLAAHGFEAAGGFDETNETRTSTYSIMKSPSGIVINLIHHEKGQSPLA